MSATGRSAAATTAPNVGSARTAASANSRAGAAPAADFTPSERAQQMKTETEEIHAEWYWRDGDPTTPEAARTFAARIKAATGRDVRATYLRSDGDNGVVFSVRDIDADAEAGRKERAIAAYRETFAKAAAAGITTATPPAVVAYTFAENVADEADEIEQEERDLRYAIEYQAWARASNAAADAAAARIAELGAKKTQAEHDRTINTLRRELELEKRARIQAERERDAARKAIVDGIS